MEKAASSEERLRGLLSSQRLGVLATENDNQPYTSLVAFAESEDLGQLYFATARSTRKYFNLKANPQAAMLFDNRSNQVSDFSDATAATAIGLVDEVSADDREAALGIYLAKHPYLREFASEPTCALMRLQVSTYLLVNRFQNVVEIRLEP